MIEDCEKHAETISFLRNKYFEIKSNIFYDKLTKRKRGLS